MVSRNDPRDDFPETSVEEASPEKRILVIGAGMSGMLMAIQLLKSGRSNIVIYEKALQIGGTWRDNVYPGLKCDVPAAMFSYSFEPNKEYSSRFPMGSEIQGYLLSTSDRYGLNQFIQFNKTVETVHWEDGRWYVQTSDGLIESSTSSSTQQASCTIPILRTSKGTSCSKVPASIPPDGRGTSNGREKESE